jgi:hypothetical protein
MPAEDQKVPREEEDIAQERSFDEMAKELANGTTSRGQALKWLMGTLLGGSLLALIPGTAQAKQQGGEQHHPHHHRGGGAGEDTCCPAGSFTTTAPTPQGECQCAPIAFAGGTQIPCNGRSCCLCTFTIEGEGFCLDGCGPIPAGTPCTSSSQCADPRTKCIVNANGGASCLPACPTTP